jgi:hypothetical protein
MPCVNHPSNDVQSYCQSCGKALCSTCVRTTPSGQILCESCLAAGAGDPSQAYWQGAGQSPYQAPPFYPLPPRGAPNPAAAAVLGLIPGVGAMYNGQLFKGLIHVVIFAVLVSITDHYPIFGLFIAGWVLYQSFEAFHTAKARRDGLPLPDPFGLNELGGWLNLGGHPGGQGRGFGTPIEPPSPPTGGFSASGTAGTAAGAEPPVYTAPYTSTWTTPQSPPNPADPGGSAGTAGSPGYVPPQGYSETYAGYPPDPNAPYGYQNYPPGYVPPIPPIPPIGWRRKEPVWAVVLIVLGVLFLLKSLGFIGHFFHYTWPLLLIGFGVWMIVRRVGYFQGGSK